MATISTTIPTFNTSHLPPVAKGRSRISNAVSWRRRGMAVAVLPDKLSEKIAESVKEAKEKCSEDPKSGECVAAWDEVEELSAAASHARDRLKDSDNSDPLEKYCKDNPGMGQCRTYED